MLGILAGTLADLAREPVAMLVAIRTRSTLSRCSRGMGALWAIQWLAR